MGFPHLDMLRSKLSLMHCGKREAALKDHHKRIGSMPPNSCDPELTPADHVFGDRKCPKCGAETEPIDVEVEGLPVDDLQLCPGCYLVIWRDRDGLHVRQGVPMKKGALRAEPPWLNGDPKDC
jgi:hypothetical protein